MRSHYNEMLINVLTEIPMRITGKKFDIILNAMHAVVDHFGGSKAIKEKYFGYTQNRMLWNLWSICQRNLAYDDTHPGFAQGHWDRILPQNIDFDMYSDNDNDEHFITALRVVGKRIGII